MRIPEQYHIRPLAPHEFSARVRALLITFGAFIVGLSIGDEHFRTTALSMGEHLIETVSFAVDTTSVQFQSALAYLSLIQ